MSRRTAAFALVIALSSVGAQPARVLASSAPEVLRGVPTGAVASAVVDLSVLPQPGAHVSYREAPFVGGRTESQPAGAMQDPSPPVVDRGRPPDLAESFAGISDDGSFPPDTNGAVGIDRSIATTNGTVTVRDRSGDVITSATLVTFWSALGVTDVFDTHVLYDPYAQRWIASSAAQRRSADASILIAVSASSDPAGSWTMSRWDADTADQSWADFDLVGFNRSWIVVSANMYGNTNEVPEGTQVLAFDKAALYAGIPAATQWQLDPTWQSLAPVRTENSSLDTMYLVSNWAGDRDGVGINVGDARISSAVYRNGSIWAAHTIFLPPRSPSRSAIQWWQISPDGTVVQRARIDDPDHFFYAFPSIAVNARSDVMIGYARFFDHPSGGYAFRWSGSPQGLLYVDGTVKDGAASYVRTDSGGRNRWGDFSATVVDPLNDVDFWTVQEYVASTDHWGTWWGHLVAPDPAPRVSLDHDSISFEPRSIETQGDAQAVTLSSTGGVPLNVGHSALDGVGRDQFVLTEDGCSNRVLGQGDSCSIAIAFRPDTPGDHIASVTIPTGAGVATIALSGTAWDDHTPPASTITTTLLVDDGSVIGRATDDVSGVDSVVVTYTLLGIGTPIREQGFLDCDVRRTSCSWIAPAPGAVGIYQVDVASTDRAGNLESPGPRSYLLNP